MHLVKKIFDIFKTKFKQIEYPWKQYWYIYFIKVSYVVKFSWIGLFLFSVISVFAFLKN